MSRLLSRLRLAKQQRENRTSARQQGMTVNVKRRRFRIILLLCLLSVLLLFSWRWFWYDDTASPADFNASHYNLASGTHQNTSSHNKPFQLQGLLYISDDPSRSKVLINGKSLTTGDSLQEGVIVTAIGNDWVELNVKGNKTTIKP